MIYFSNPYNSSGNIGIAYNHYASLAPNDNDWLCFTDGDTMFPYPDFGSILEEIIEANPEYSFFTCLTNRVGDKRQCYKGTISNTRCLSDLYRTAQIVKRAGTHVETIKAPISGHLMLFKKSLWNEVKFQEKGILAVDNQFSNDVANIGYEIGLMKGFFLIHYYRLREGIHYKTHLL